MIQIIRSNFIFGMISKINIKLLITFISFVFIGTSIYGNFESLSNQSISSEDISWLLLGIVFSFLSIIINAYAWKLLINNIGCNMNNLYILRDGVFGWEKEGYELFDGINIPSKAFGEWIEEEYRTPHIKPFELAKKIQNKEKEN